MSEKHLKTLYSFCDEARNLNFIGHVLHWDKETNMPGGGAKNRANQLELISRLHHQRIVHPDFLEAIDSLSESITSLAEIDQINVRELKRQADLKRKLPEEFVANKSRAISTCSSAWAKARSEDDFDTLVPLLDTVFDTLREEADLLGFEAHPYDALLDLYEPGLKLSIIKPLLTELGDGLKEIIPKLTDKFADVSLPDGNYPTDQQHALNERVLSDLGYSFETGRLDIAHHPFQATLGVNDHRVTTRYHEDNYLQALLSTMHEAGHAFYELGLNREQLGYPAGHSISMGMHESLSRLWENLVGRSREFSVYLHNILEEFFPEEQKQTSPEKLWKQLNKVEPSLIRVEADEVSYSLHIVIRMLLEEQIATGEITAKELPKLWKEHYEHFLGIAPPNNSNGVMQDVHWFWGNVGYFPTYALGNIFNGVYLEAILKDIPDMYAQIEQGKFHELLSWLNKNIHEHGMKYGSFELVEKLTGREVNSSGFLSYIREKHGIAQ